MKTNFAKKTANFGCYNESKKQNNYLPNEAFTISDVLNSDVSLKDKTWFIRKNCEFTNDEYRQFAIGCALCVLPIYESKYPGNDAPRKAIEAAQKYLANEIGIDELIEARRAAAYAAYTAAIADSAYAAHAAAYAYAAADGKVSYKSLLLEFFKEFTPIEVNQTL